MWKPNLDVIFLLSSSIEKGDFLPFFSNWRKVLGVGKVTQCLQMLFFQRTQVWVHSTSAGLQLPVSLAQGSLMPFLAPEGTHPHVHFPHIHIFKSILKYFEVILKFIIKMLLKSNTEINQTKDFTIQWTSM